MKGMASLPAKPMSAKLEMSNFGYGRGHQRARLRALVHVALALGGLVWFLHLLFNYCKCQPFEYTEYIQKKN